MADNQVEAVMKARFHELGQERQAIMDVSMPLRAQRDAMIAAQQAELEPLTAAVKAAEQGLYEIEHERGKLVRYFRDENGVSRMGEPPQG